MTTSEQERLNELEIRLAFQDDLLDSLNQTVASQQQELMEIKQLCRQLLTQWRETASPNEKFRPEDNVPPHF